jgi:exopolysaccharide production protein ExoQ
MPPILALILTVAFVFFLFWRESREKIEVSRALWIPLLWILVTGSRFVSQWLSLGSWTFPYPDEGSPVDAIYFFSLIVAGVCVLSQRQIKLAEFVRNNRWLTIFLLYCLLAILWSDLPFLALKRFIKTMAHPIMALIVLTETDPQAALRRLLKRCAYVLVPFSILFIKYFPEYGRGFDNWTGLAYNQGVNLNKNELGYCCMIFGMFFFWNAMQAFRIRDWKARRNELVLSVGFLGMVLWLLRLAASATSLSSMSIGIVTMVLIGLPFVNKRLVGLYVVLGILAFAVAEPTFGIYKHILNFLGRDATLTDRTEVWHAALRLQPDPIFGAGFESFWSGKRLEKLWSIWWWKPNQAHNGYIETYLNLGYVGVFLLAVMIIATFRKIRLALLSRFELGRFRLGCLFAILAYNFTEATFKGVHLVWTLFYLIAVDYPPMRSSRLKVTDTVSGKGKLSEPVPVRGLSAVEQPDR